LDRGSFATFSCASAFKFFSITLGGSTAGWWSWKYDKMFFLASFRRQNKRKLSIWWLA